MISTKVGQARHMGKHEAAAQMVRLVRELAEKLEEAGLLEKNDPTAIDDVLYTFLAGQPKKVHDEVLHG